jgi:catechol 2,3-dioxygenase-like lactoylglutathione lyase family enzyme
LLQEGWKAHRKAHPARINMSSQRPHKAVLLAAEPQLFVADMLAAFEFYQKRLGFSLGFSYGNPPFYAQVARDGARLNLRHLDKPSLDPEIRDREDLLSASVVLDDATPLFLEYQAAGVPFARTLRTEPWGARTFIVRDPDGNLLLFAGRCEQSSAAPASSRNE